MTAVGSRQVSRVRVPSRSSCGSSVRIRGCPSSELGYLTTVDHVRHEALIAVDPDTHESFGTARYIRSDDDPATAEFAIGVGDRWMRIGLGTALLEALARRARDDGIARFTGLIHSENKAIRRLVENVIGPFTTTSAGPGAQEMLVDLGTESSRGSVHRQANTGSST